MTTQGPAAAEVAVPSRRSAREWSVPVAIIVVGATLSGVLTAATARELRATREARFERLAVDARTAIERRIAAYVEHLYGLRSFFAADRGVTRREFAFFVRQADLQVRSPGAIALSFNRFVPRAKVPAYERRIRRDPGLAASGYPGFTVRPKNASGDAFVVEYIEPVEGNESAVGFDVGSEASRRAGVIEARDTGEAIATEPLPLIQEGDDRGFVVFLAVYDRDLVPVTKPARRRSLEGVVAAAFRTDEMLSGVLGSHPSVDLEIYDVGRIVDPKTQGVTGAALVYDPNGRSGARNPVTVAGPRRFLDLNVANRRWRIFASARPGTGLLGDGTLPVARAFGLSVLTLLLAALVYAVNRSRRMAERLAAEMTSHLRARERELSEANRRLADADAQKTAFLGTVSHELRTPLTAITGFGSLLLADPSLQDERHRDYVSRISRNAAALGILIDELLDYTRLERQGLPLEVRPFSLSTLVPRVVDQLATVLSTHRVDLDVEPNVLASGDPQAATRVLTNLLTNAVKFSPPDATVTVSVAVADGMAEIRVADGGPGIPEEERSAVFDPFYRGRHADGGPAGTGIGLAVVTALVAQMGGRVWVEGAPGGGALFRVLLPRA